MLKDLNIKIFADGADLVSIKNLDNDKNISGFTTNPSLMKKAGVSDYKKFCLDVLNITKNKPVSFEIFSDDLDEMYEQAMEIAAWGDSIFVKIPITNSKGKKTTGVIKKLLNQNVKCNVTAILTIEQVKEIFEISNNETKVIISIFAGRIADTGINPIPMMSEAVKICKDKKNIEILWASTREAYNFIQAKQLRCNIITMPPKVINQISSFGKSYKTLTLDTVKGFLTDSKKSQFKI